MLLRSRLAHAWRAASRRSFSNSSSSSSSVAPAPSASSSSVPAVGGPVAEHALLGLSPEYRELLLRRAARAHSVPVLYSNPGAYAQLDRLPEGVLAALPPPPRPLYPMTEREHTARLARGFAFGLFFAALALYLHLKRTSRSGPRLELERRAPLLARALVAVGALQDLGTGTGAGIDRAALFRRVFARYCGGGAAAVSGGGGSGGSGGSEDTMPVGRALFLLSVLLDETGGVATAAAAGGGSGAPSAGAGASSASAAVDLAARAALAEAGLSQKVRLAREEFVALLLSSAGLRAQSDTLVALTCAESLGVAVAAPEALEALGGLYDRLVAGRAAGCAFSAAALTEVCRDAGFVADEADAAAFLADCAFASPSAAVPAPPAATAPLRREQFVDFLAGAALAAGVPGARIGEYVQTYELLHLSGLREAAGVPASSA
jgi:hypothetical protein